MPQARATDRNLIPPMVDFSRIPEEYEGLWLVLRRSDQAILGSGDTLNKALRESKRSQDDPSIVLARVPTEPTVLVIQPRPLEDQ